VLATHDLRAVHGDYRAALPATPEAPEAPLEAVRSIIADVRMRGDAALAELTERFDGAAPQTLRVSQEEISAALEAIPDDVREALVAAQASIAAFHREDRDASHHREHNGLKIESVRRPVDRAGLYVPGGRASYPSTVLMTAVPARAAGVEQVIMCVPPGPDGHVATVTLAAAAVAGVDEVYAVGGAQAVAAMAYGTDTITPVDVIAGPGNIYVALAQREVADTVGIAAAFAGPSEVVVIADHTAPTDLAAIDVIVQAEHGPNGMAWLITWDDEVAEAVHASIREQVAVAPRREDIEATMAVAGHIAIVRDAQQAVDVANAIAPEHLQIMTADADAMVAGVRHAGAVFVGPMAPASFGDYIAGPSHVLPTNGTARFASALGVDDFVKHHHVVRISEEAFRTLGPHVEALAAAEGLDAHAQSVRLRMKDNS